MAVCYILIAKRHYKTGGCPSLYGMCLRALTTKPKQLAGQGPHRECATFWPGLIVSMRFQFEQREPSLPKIEQLFRTLRICALHAPVALAPHSAWLRDPCSYPLLDVVAFSIALNHRQAPPLFDSDHCSLTNKSITGSVHGEELPRLFRVGVALVRNCELSKCVRSAAAEHGSFLLSRTGPETTITSSRSASTNPSKSASTYTRTCRFTSFPGRLARGTLVCNGEG
jgi:hypothetical protein